MGRLLSCFLSSPIGLIQFHRCAGISSEVARLWRIVVLNPRPSSGTRQEILQKISGWKKKGIVCQFLPQVSEPYCLLNQSLCNTNVMIFFFSFSIVKGWRGLGVALKLGQVVDENPEVVKLMKTACRTVPSVTVCTEKRLEFRGETKAGMFSRGNNHSRIFDFQWPHRISFNCEIDLDIDTVCYLIEALHFLGKKDESLRLAVSLSLAILAFYEGFIVPEGSEREKTSASRNVFLGGKTCASNKGVFKVKNRKRFPSGCTRVDPDGQLQLTTIVFLFDLLSKSAGVDAIIFEVSRDRLSSQSLAFQFGVVGLFLPMYPTRTGQLEVSVFKIALFLVLPNFHPPEGRIRLRVPIICTYIPYTLPKLSLSPPRPRSKRCLSDKASLNKLNWSAVCDWNVAGIWSIRCRH